MQHTSNRYGLNCISEILTLKIGLLPSVFFLFSLWYESYHKVETGYLITLKFGTQEGDVTVRVHLYQVWLREGPQQGRIS